MKAIIKFLLLFAGGMYFSSAASAQIIRLDSYLPAQATIYLDFDGEYVAGTSWNWNGPINAQAASLTNAEITEIFNRVSEDYRPFNVNVTTNPAVYMAAPSSQRIRIIVTATSAWYGSAGGVSFVSSFTWGDDTPAWVFSSLLLNNVKYIAEACSHEIGHTLGLQHQSTFDANCQKTAEYSQGQGDGEIGWAPIMGVGYYKNLTTWHIGSSSAGCNFIQNDLDILASAANGFGLRDDDHGNTTASATTVNMPGQNFSVQGLINKQVDADEFKLVLQTTTNLRLNVVPENVGIGNEGADIDIKVALLNSNADTIGIYNPVTLLGVGIDTTLHNGTYYFTVTATANANHFIYGSLGYYTITGSVGIVLPLHQFILKANRVLGENVLTWNYLTDETIMHMVVEVSSDGRIFLPLVTLDATARSFSYKPMKATGYYRLRAITASDEKSYYSNISYLLNEKESKPVQFLSNVVQDQLTVASEAGYSYQVFDASGALFLQGRLPHGISKINLVHVAKGVFFMRIFNGVDGWTEKLIKQ